MIFNFQKRNVRIGEQHFETDPVIKLKVKEEEEMMRS
ncbi:hypothetical protein PAGL106935_18570 [Paenibacillus glucanolyticus]|jgi:hypothetical protein